MNISVHCILLSRLEFHIKASDHGEPPLSSRARITLNVRDVNDHSPVIKQNFIVQHDNEAGEAAL